MEPIIKRVGDIQPGKEFTLVPVSTDTREGDSFLMQGVKKSGRDHTIEIAYAERYDPDPSKRQVIPINANREAELVIADY